jgi:hypothetical protein
MCKLTLRIKPNDKVYLKYNLRDACQDPQYEANWCDLLVFRGEKVIIEYVIVKHRYDELGTFLGNYYYINVRDRRGNQCEFPIEFIDRSKSLSRDHHVMSLHNKILICE